TPALKHRRRVFCLPGRFWVIADELLGAGGVEAESFIHLHPDVQLAAVCRGRPVFTAARSDAAQVQIVPAGMHEMRAVHGIEDARPQGWYASRHGERRSAPVLSLLAIGRLPLVFRYALVPRTAVLAGRLYNRRELTVALGGRHSLSGRDDAEIVAHLYEERGLKCVKALRGAFALALWDAQRGRLLLARDHLGLVPLYFAADGHRLAASSALRALTALPGVAQAWDAAALDTFLTFGFIPPPGTLHPAIRQLAPAELAVWEGGRLRLQRYWHLSFPERRLAAADAAVLVRDQARDAIRLRLAGVVGGLLLSDGLDAAAILSLVAADERPPAAAYTATFAGEGRGAARLAAQLGVKHVPVDTAPDWPALLDGLLAAEGGPGASLDDAVLAVAIARAAADLRVALAGVGGEEIFGSSAPARAAARVRYYGSLPAVARELIVVTGRVAPALLSSAVHATIGAARLAPLELYARTVSLVLPEERATLYTPEALALMGDATPWRSLAALFADAAAAGATDTRDAIHYVEVAFRLPARAS